MDLVPFLLSTIGVPAAIVLLKTWLKTVDVVVELEEEAGKSLLKIAAEKFTNVFLRHGAKREFDTLGQKIAMKLLPLFEEARERGDCDLEKVGNELKFTLGTKPSPGLLVEQELDLSRIAAELRARHQIDLSKFTLAERELYEMALDQCVRYLVNVASELPAFHVEVAEQLLSRMGNIAANVDKALEHVLRIEQVVIDNPQNALARYEADYRQAICRSLDYLELFGADIPPEARRHSLSVAYVSLYLQEGDSEDDGEASMRVEDVLDELPVNEGRLLIRGEAGSGKSTLFRWIAITAAEGEYSAMDLQLPEGRGRLESVSSRSLTFYDRASAEERWSSWWRRRIPFLVRLREFTSGKLPAPGELPELIAKEIGRPPADWVLTVLKSGKGLLLLDGVDEIPGVNRETLKNEIRTLVDAYPTCQFIISTRPQAVDPGWLAELDFRESNINPLSERDKAALIDKWFEAVAKEQRQYDPQFAGMAERMKARLKGTPAINRLAKYPLLAAMICAYYRGNKEILPKTEVDLLERLCEILLHKRDELSLLPACTVTEAYAELEYRPKKLIVQDLAYRMMALKGESSINRDDAVDSVRNRLERLSVKADADKILTSLIERSGMLREPVPHHVTFLHNAFKEYLTALRLVDEDAVGLLATHWKDAEWLPVILYAAATSVTGFASNLILKILSSSVSADDNSEMAKAPGKRRTRSMHMTASDIEIRQRQVLALRCRAVALDVDPQLQLTLDGQRASLFPPLTLTDGEALANAGDMVVDDLAPYWNSANHKTRAACVRALRLIATDKAKEALQPYFGDEHPLVLTELATLCDPLQIPAVLRWVEAEWTLKKKISQRAVRSLIANISILADRTSAESIDLSGTDVSDIAPLANHSSLRYLNLSGSLVSDFFPLSELKSLERLAIPIVPVGGNNIIRYVTSIMYRIVECTIYLREGRYSENEYVTVCNTDYSSKKAAIVDAINAIISNSTRSPVWVGSVVLKLRV